MSIDPRGQDPGGPASVVNENRSTYTVPVGNLAIWIVFDDIVTKQYPFLEVSINRRTRPRPDCLSTSCCRDRDSICIKVLDVWSRDPICLKMRARK